MIKNKISDLRDHLFETIELLKEDSPLMTIAKAKMIAEVSQVIINTSKLEVDTIKVIDNLTGFYPALSNGFIEVDHKNALKQ